MRKGTPRVPFCIRSAVVRGHAVERGTDAGRAPRTPDRMRPRSPTNVTKGRTALLRAYLRWGSQNGELRVTSRIRAKKAGAYSAADET